MNSVAVDLPGFGASLALSFVALGVVCLVAWLSLRWLARRGLGGSTRSDSLQPNTVELLHTERLSGRHVVYVVRLAGRGLVLGGGEGSLSTLAEMTADELEDAASKGTQRSDNRAFGRILERSLGFRGRSRKKRPDEA